MKSVSKISVLSFLSSLAFKNSIYIFLARVSFIIASLIISILAARTLGLTGFGILSLVLSLFTMFELLITLGLDNVIIRDVAISHSKTKLFFSHGIIIGLLASLIGFLLLLALSNLMQYSQEIKIAIYQMASLLFPSFLYYLLENIFIGLEKAKVVLVGALCRDVSLVIIGFYLLGREASVQAVITSIFMARMIGCAGLLILAWQKKVELFSFLDFGFLKSLSRSIPTFFWIGIASCVFLEIDTVILSKTLAVSELGLYNLAKRIFRVSNIFYYSVAMASFPTITQTLSTSMENRISVHNRLLKAMAVLSFGLILMTFLFSGVVIHFFFGEQFMMAVKYIKILIWAVMPLSLSLLFSRFLIAGGEQSKDLYSTVLGLIVLFSLGVLFSIKWQATGMAVAYVFSSFVMAGFFYYFTWRMLRLTAKGANI